MKHDLSFNHAEFIRQAMDPILGPGDSDADCILGICWANAGIAIVALTPENLRTLKLRNYSNIVLGPNEGDWHVISNLIALLPQIFEGKNLQVVLGGACDRQGHALPVRASFERAFPRRIRTVKRTTVDEWASKLPVQIAVPNIPSKESWCIKPLIAAAETALFACCQMGARQSWFAGAAAGLRERRSNHDDG